MKTKTHTQSINASKDIHGHIIVNSLHSQHKANERLNVQDETEKWRDLKEALHDYF